MNVSIDFVEIVYARPSLFCISLFLYLNRLWRTSRNLVVVLCTALWSILHTLQEPKYLYSLLTKLTPWSGSLPDKFSVARLSEISCHFVQPECLLPCLQELSHSPYPERHKSNPYYSIISQYYSPIYIWVFLVVALFWLSHSNPI